MKRHEVVLAAMAPAQTKPFKPVQVQKLFFLLDKNIAEFTDGPHFDFQPFDYGPFDKSVYQELEKLGSCGLIEIIMDDFSGSKTFRLTPNGYNTGIDLLRQQPDVIGEYIDDIVDWLLTSSFSQIVSTIYKEYPEMSVNSVFVNRGNE